MTYPRFAGTNVPRDFVEYPSQVNEMWADWPQVLAHYAHHYQTGAAMPKELLDKVEAASKFNQGFATSEYLAAAILDQAWHQLKPEQVPDAAHAMEFEAKALHEGAGVVLEVGKGVTSLKPGDHVIPLYTPECRECEYCLNPKTNLCQAIRSTQGQGLMPDGSSRFSLNGERLFHYMAAGAAALGEAGPAGASAGGVGRTGAQAASAQREIGSRNRVGCRMRLHVAGTARL